MSSSQSSVNSVKFDYLYFFLTEGSEHFFTPLIHSVSRAGVYEPNISTFPPLRPLTSMLPCALSVYFSEVSPVWPGLYSVERQAADHLLPQRIAVGRVQLRPLPAGWRWTRCQVPGGGAGSARLLTVLWERGAIPGGMEVEMVWKWLSVQVSL